MGMSVKAGDRSYGARGVMYVKRAWSAASTVLSG